MLRSLAGPVARTGRLLLLAAVLFAVACSDQSNEPNAPPTDDPSLARGGVQGPDLRAAFAAHARHADALLERSGVEGMGVGLTGDGRPALRVFTRHGAVGGVPATLDGVPVVVEISGEFRAILPRAKPSAAGGNVDPKDRFARPVPIGVSTGNEGECSAGTIGARVRNGGTTFALSNNHVFALENAAPIGSRIAQPGRFDTRCTFAVADAIGTLADFEPLRFDGSNNTIDAAIAAVTTANLGTATPSNGYGTPRTQTVSPAVGMAVQKYGRTTKLTTGTITTIGTTVNVSYGAGTARFVNQVVIAGSKGAFSRSGDSGSLIVTAPGQNPVALLFAGSSSVTIGNPIGPVLQRFGVTIDGQ